MADCASTLRLSTRWSGEIHRCRRLPSVPINAGRSCGLCQLVSLALMVCLRARFCRDRGALCDARRREGLGLALRRTRPSGVSTPSLHCALCTPYSVCVSCLARCGLPRASCPRPSRPRRPWVPRTGPVIPGASARRSQPRPRSLPPQFLHLLIPHPFTRPLPLL